MTNFFGRTKFHQFFLAAALLLVCQPAFAEKRVALVIGNAAYQNVARLPNPVNDGNTDRDDPEGRRLRRRRFPSRSGRRRYPPRAA